MTRSFAKAIRHLNLLNFPKHTRVPTFTIFFTDMVDAPS